MANRQNGEVSITIDGKVYTMAMTIDAMVALEEMFTTPQKAMTFQEVSDLCEAGSMKHLRALLWAVFQAHHPDIEIKDVSRLVQAAGGLGEFTVKLMQLVKATQPDPKDLAALGIKADANPPQAQARKATRGNGARSISAPVGKA